MHAHPVFGSLLTLILSVCSRKAVVDLELAEEKIMCSLEAASSAFRSLATVESSRAAGFDSHAESFLTNLAEAQQLMGKRISQLGPDVPFENGSMRPLIEADIAVQKLAHVHLALQRALRCVDAPEADQLIVPSVVKFDSEPATSGAVLASSGNDVDSTAPVTEMQADIAIDDDFGLNDSSTMDLVG